MATSFGIASLSSVNDAVVEPDLEAILEAKRAKRRVPPDKRKRAAQSCARCKDKRVRCVRDEGADVCQACIKANAHCSALTSEPRKQRRQNTNSTSSKATTGRPRQSDDNIEINLTTASDGLWESTQTSAPHEHASRDALTATEEVRSQQYFLPQHNPTEFEGNHFIRPFQNQQGPQASNSASSANQPSSAFTTYSGNNDTSTLHHIAPTQPSHLNEHPPVRITQIADGARMPPSVPYNNDSSLSHLGPSINVRQEQADTPVQTQQRQSPVRATGPQFSAPSSGQIQTPSQESHEHNDVTGQTHYIGPSASLSFVADLRSLIRQYDANAPFVRDTFVQALGGEQTASSLLTGGAGGWLPSTSDLSSIVEAFFRLVHPGFPILRQTAVWQALEAMSPTSDFSDTWQLVLAGIIALSLSAQGSLDFNTQGTASAVAQLIFGRIACSTSFLGLQGLLLYSYYLHNHNQRDAAWNMMGAAVRMAMALGMHRHSSNWSNLSISERETRKLAFWTMYSFERFLCATLGRPSALQDIDIVTDMPLDWAVETVGHMPLGYIEQDTALAGIMGRISHRMYGSHASNNTEDVERFLNELSRWKLDLPRYFDTDSPMPQQHKRAILAMHARYHALRAYITRPSLSKYMLENNNPGKLSPDELRHAVRLARICLDAAVDCTKVLMRLHKDDPSCGRTSTVLYWAYISTLVFAVPLACELVRRRSVNDPNLQNQAQLRSMPDITPGRETLVSCLRDCLYMLDPNKELAPTFTRFAQVARDVCAAIQVEARQATAHVASRPSTSSGHMAVVSQPKVLPAGSATTATATSSNSTAPISSSETAKAPFGPSFMADPGQHVYEHEQLYQPHLQQGDMSAVAPFQSASNSIFQSQNDNNLDFGFDFGIDPSILDNGQSTLPGSQQTQQWDDLLQWLQGTGEYQ